MRHGPARITGTDRHLSDYPHARTRKDAGGISQDDLSRKKAGTHLGRIL